MSGRFFSVIALSRTLSHYGVRVITLIEGTEIDLCQVPKQSWLHSINQPHEWPLPIKKMHLVLKQRVAKTQIGSPIVRILRFELSSSKPVTWKAGQQSP